MRFLSRLLENYGIEVSCAGPVSQQFLEDLDANKHDVLLIDQDEDLPMLAPKVAEQLKQWPRPVLFFVRD